MPLGPEEAIAARAVVTAIQIAHKQGLFGSLLEALKEKHKVLILGTTGVGKSNFVSSLESLLPAAIDRMERTSQVVEKRIRVDRRLFDLIDTPGDPARQAYVDDAITDSLTRGKPFGLIHVVSWGYHEYGRTQAKALDGDRPNPTWLADHRKIEVSQMIEWAPRLGGRPSYTITLVTKADLWWAEYDEVMAHYSDDGAYRRVARAVASGHHITLPYSSVAHPFYGVVPGSGSFSTADQQRCQQKLLEELLISIERIQRARDRQS